LQILNPSSDVSSITLGLTFKIESDCFPFFNAFSKKIGTNRQQPMARFWRHLKFNIFKLLRYQLTKELLERQPSQRLIGADPLAPLNPAEIVKQKHLKFRRSIIDSGCLPRPII